MADEFDLGRVVGSRIRFTSNAPTAAVGEYLDCAIDTSTGDVYEKTSEYDWTKQGNFTGPTGPSGTMSVGTVTSTAAWEDAAVTNSGTDSAAVLDFVLPRGQDGYSLESTSMVVFSVDENSHLLCYYEGDVAPNYEVKADGHLYLTIQDGATSLDLGNVIGPTGPQGAKGNDGVLISSSSMVVFGIDDDGRLICGYDGDTPPGYYIGEDGHLWLQLDTDGQSYDLGQVRTSYSNATTSTAGLMSATDKARLDSLWTQFSSLVNANEVSY